MAATALPADDMMDDVAPVDPEREAQRLRESLSAIADRLEKDAHERVQKRKPIEERWLRDLEQYHGEYDPETKEDLYGGRTNKRKSPKSKLFVNLTRSKTNAMSARIMDLLFPTDDRNWGIQPTPVPDLTQAAKSAVEAVQAKEKEAMAAAAAAQANPEDPAAQQAAVAAAMEVSQIKARTATVRAMLDEANKRAEAMTEEMDDQLKESRYQAIARDVIEMAAKIGTGVIKGPVVGERLRKRWVQQPMTDEYGQPMLDDAGQPVTQYVLDQAPGDRPAFIGVDIWNWFPSNDARSTEESAGFFERHLMNAKRMRRLAKLGFDQDAIRRLLQAKPGAAAPDYLTQLRNINGEQNAVANDLFHVWEYNGPLDPDDMKTLAIMAGDDATAREMDEIDPLAEVQACVWFCQGEVLKFNIYPYDSGEPLYSVFCLEKDESSIWGYGVPYMMRHPQRMLNAAARMMMDNAAWSVGPQIVVRKGKLEPSDGTWTMRAGKIWWATEDVPANVPAFEVYHIEGHQAELANIMALAQKHIDEETAMPMIAQGEQGTGVTKTAQGMAILMNAANVVFRRIIKNFDDDFTVPNLRRLYDWNMQFNPNEAIKGDMEVDARGSSVLLVKEMQAQNLLQMAMAFSTHPIFGPMLKNRDMLRKIFQAHMIPSDDVMLSDEEIDAVLARAAQEASNGEMELKMKELELRERELALKEAQAEDEIERANMEADTRRYIADRNFDATMFGYAERANLDAEKVDAMREKYRTDASNKRAEIDQKERGRAVEVAMKERTGVSSGGAI